MQELRLLLYPFSVLYDGITSLRNYAFDRGILEQKEYQIPIIAVGNLSTGGTGKTPMIEYLIRHFTGKKIGVLSRGYGRNTSGYIELSENDSTERAGDEPLQIKRKFKNLIVSAVCEKRVDGIERLLKEHQLDLILLDDAFQHRYVKASHYVLLTSYDMLYVDDYLLPAGNLRESRKGAQRAQTIIVTKCPADISAIQRNEVKLKLKLLPGQQVYFSYIGYEKELQGVDHKILLDGLRGKKVTVVTGIAKPKPFLKHLKGFIKIEHLNYSDHHDFTLQEVETIRNKKLVITTEKDFMRLKKHELRNLYYLPIQTEFVGKEPVL
ncbi:tetraacyldisaccharide 4'-kinase [Nonlabens sp. Ci31]|uniref:tetraacyldisaccharide 4'-kinase n=1 Tax=Nonlabens sp. Ci31 TaxID=2608253 RepID=UPI0014630A64|nr:tetraacyldisaccharide 4'-kinase [Nonlabens sp. Ci31]QJP34436.1 tetraacyldisaccharide 4'-kinase [Nonlabens sp. Ci31]